MYEACCKDFIDSEVTFQAYAGNDADINGLCTALMNTFNIHFNTAKGFVRDKVRIRCTAAQFGAFIVERKDHVAINQIRHLNATIEHKVKTPVEPKIVDLRPGKY